MTRRNTSVPNPFPIPMFRGNTEENLANSRLGEDDRKYMVRVLATMLSTHVQDPSMRDCAVVAESLLRKFSFLKESNSWRQYIYVRCQNINRRYSREYPGPKRIKTVFSTKHVYADVVIESEDEISHQRNKDHLKKEIDKAKPKPEIIKELIRRTLKKRREIVLSGSVRPAEILLDFPQLPGIGNCLESFVEAWGIWRQAVLDYASSSVNKSKLLLHALRDQSSDDAEAESLTAFRCLAHFLVTKKKKAGSDPEATSVDIPHILMEGKRGTPTSEVVCRDTNQPHLVRLVDDDLPTQYYVVVEQSIQMEVACIMKGILLLLSLHYVYDFQYNQRVKDFYKFLEHKLLNMSSEGKDSANFLNITSALESYNTQEDQFFLLFFFLLFC